MNIKSSVAVDFFLPGRAKDLSAPLYSDHEEMMADSVSRADILGLKNVKPT
jgi:hypothetical protein